MKLNHIIIGAGRSGTTSLVAYLKQHPKINFSSIKEVTYFSIDEHYERGKDFFHSFFKKQNNIIATSDTYLLMSKEAPIRIKQYNPAIKLAVILREPSERTYSNFYFSINNDHINKDISFMESQQKEQKFIKDSDIIKQNNYCNFYGSLYYKHLSYWLTYFKKEQLFICTTNELKNNPQKLMDRYFTFLGINSISINQLQAQHKAYSVKNKQLNKFLTNRNHWLRKLISKPLQKGILRNIVLNSNVVDKIKEKNKNNFVYPRISVEEKKFCDEYFQEDLNLLSKEFGIKF